LLSRINFPCISCTFFLPPPEKNRELSPFPRISTRLRCPDWQVTATCLEAAPNIRLKIAFVA
jgi:hypothetical protein